MGRNGGLRRKLYAYQMTSTDNPHSPHERSNPFGSSGGRRRAAAQIYLQKEIMSKEAVYCPICGSRMTAMRVESEDGSGWTFGWGCACTAEKRADDPRSEVIVYSSIVATARKIVSRLTPETGN